jgi:hypothetical protein
MEKNAPHRPENLGEDECAGGKKMPHSSIYQSWRQKSLKKRFPDHPLGELLG